MEDVVDNDGKQACAVCPTQRQIILQPDSPSKFGNELAHAKRPKNEDEIVNLRGWPYPSGSTQAGYRSSAGLFVALKGSNSSAVA
jgi:hypothetical protein